MKLSASRIPGGSIGRKSSIRRRQAVTVPKASVGSNLKKRTRREKVKGAVVNELTEGAYFGEVGLLSATNRNTSTVQAISDSFVAYMSRENFEAMLSQFGDPLREAFYERLLDYGAVDEQIVMLRNIVALRDIEKRQLLRLALALRVEYLKPGDVILRQGQLDRRTYFVKKGEVSVKIQGQNFGRLRKAHWFNFSSAICERRSIFEFRAEENTSFSMNGEESADALSTYSADEGMEQLVDNPFKMARILERQEGPGPISDFMPHVFEMQEFSIEAEGGQQHSKNHSQASQKSNLTERPIQKQPNPYQVELYVLDLADLKRISGEHRQLSLMVYDTRPRKYDYGAWRTLDGSDLSVQAQSAELFSFPHAYRNCEFDRRIIVARTYMQTLRLKKARAAVIDCAKRLKSCADPETRQVQRNLRLVDQKWLLQGSLPETRHRRSVIGSKSLFLFSELLRVGNSEDVNIKKSLEALMETINKQKIWQSEDPESQAALTDDRVREIIFGQRPVRSRLTSQIHSAPAESLVASTIRATPDKTPSINPNDSIPSALAAGCTGGVPLFQQQFIPETMSNSALAQITDFGLSSTRNDTKRLLQSTTLGTTTIKLSRVLARSRPEKHSQEPIIFGSKTLSDC